MFLITCVKVRLEVVKRDVFLIHKCQIFCRSTEYCGIFHIRIYFTSKGPGGHDHMVVGFTTTYAISAYHHSSCEFESGSCRGVLDTTLCDKVCQWILAGQWFSQGTPVSSTNKTDCHNINEILFESGVKTP